MLLLLLLLFSLLFLLFTHIEELRIHRGRGLDHVVQGGILCCGGHPRHGKGRGTGAVRITVMVTVF